jgi:hypothetical protein
VAPVGAALIAPLVVHSQLIRQEVPIMIGFVLPITIVTPVAMLIRNQKSLAGSPG